MAVGKIKEFNVESGNWTLYCGRMDMYFRANGIKEELKLPTLIAVVGDAVYELMVNLCSPKSPTEYSYTELIKVVREHLQPKPSIMAERSSDGSAAHRHIDQLKRKSSCVFPSEVVADASGVAECEQTVVACEPQAQVVDEAVATTVEQVQVDASPATDSDIPRRSQRLRFPVSRYGCEID